MEEGENERKIEKRIKKERERKVTSNFVTTLFSYPYPRYKKKKIGALAFFYYSKYLEKQFFCS